MTRISNSVAKNAVGLNQSEPSLPIVETFHSVQGEGAWTGTSAFFIRLAGCDVGCPWCDTKESWNVRRHADRSIADLVSEAVQVQPAIVVITGGEPLMHDLTDLTRSLHTAKLRVHLETSGAYPLSGTFDWITVSPKRHKPPQPSIYNHANELKIVVAEALDLEWAEQQAVYVSPDTLKLLQPEWNTPDSTALVFDYVLRHPAWRVSLQTHKFLGVR
ncbi:7-carboxy-7-deazaguanine synthase QueE [filamentous cyanobacterium CCP1]|nr:7-carboxy-7-deazaguanine synthase QueE [filamentous cyanobacterium CCP2]PSB57722.1 7-carboxy-7-deazaguanine synthase QueE [filamentous cyanobacterium CCP1]